MNLRHLHARLLSLLALATVAGCAGGGGSGGPAPAPDWTTRTPSTAERVAPPSRGSEAMERTFQEEVERRRTRYVEADVHFMQGMIGHHAQALAMVSLVADRSTNPSIHLLAGRIENSQRDEIHLMESWLRDRGEQVPEWHLHGSRLTLHGGGDHAHMPGMLSDEQMARLEAATGREFDRRFLTYMIQHHQGAVEMVRVLFATDGAAQDPDVFRFSSDVQVDQRTEIARMERMLRDPAVTGSLP